MCDIETLLQGVLHTDSLWSVFQSYFYFISFISFAFSFCTVLLQGIIYGLTCLGVWGTWYLWVLLCLTVDCRFLKQRWPTPVFSWCPGFQPEKPPVSQRAGDSPLLRVPGAPQSPQRGQGFLFSSPLCLSNSMVLDKVPHLFEPQFPV